MAFSVPPIITRWLGKKVRAGKAGVIAWLATAVVIGLAGWLKLYALPRIGEQALSIARSAYGVDIAVADWSVDLLGPRLVAKDFSWKAPGAGFSGVFTEPNLLKADSIAVSFTYGGLLRALTGGDGIGVLKDIKVRRPTIVIENQVNGSWNWAMALSSSRIARSVSDATRSLEEAGGQPGGAQMLRFDVASIEVRDLHLVWIEHLSANSGGGRTQRLTSSLHIDDGKALLTDLRGLVQRGGEDLPMQVHFDGRTADGIIQIGGAFNPFLWSSSGSSGPGGDRIVPTDAQRATLLWTPYLDALNIYLENVNVSPIAGMVPDSLVMPKSGRMTGKIAVSMSRAGLVDYRADMRYDGVEWGLNEKSSIYPTRGAAKISDELARYKHSGWVKASSRGQVGDANFRFVPSLQLAMNTSALRDAAPVVRASAAADRIRFEDRKHSPESTELEKAARTLAAVHGIVLQAGQIASTLNRIEVLRNGLPSRLPGGLRLPARPPLGR